MFFRAGVIKELHIWYLYYVLVYLPQTLEPPHFFILHSSTVMNEIAKLRKATLEKGKTWSDSGAGINWRTSQGYKDCWSVLPQ
jgi:hypothetical protein